MHKSGNLGEPSIFTNPDSIVNKIVGTAPKKKPRKYSVVGCISSPVAPRNPAICGAKNKPAIDNTAPTITAKPVVIVKMA